MSYKDRLEEFMANHNGTSLSENFVIVSISPLLTFFVTAFIAYTHTKLKCRGSQVPLSSFIIEFTALILPLLLCCTVFESYHHIFLCALLAAFVVASIVIINLAPSSSLKDIDEDKSTDHRAFISYFRSLIAIYTAICILAVDFKIFPRRFAKTEMFGYSLMDTGVAFYIVANSVVVRVQKPVSTYLELKTHFSQTRSLLLLGALRLFLLHITDYHQRDIEYGVHWNFFFTLAFVKLLSPIFISFSSKALFLILVFIIVTHQYCLGPLGLQDWVLSDAPRDTLLSANREGLVSLPGYLSLFVFGLLLSRKLRHKLQLGKDVRNMVSLFIWFILCLTMTILIEYSFNTCRRVANATYVLWMMSMSLLMLSVSMIVEVCLSLHFSLIGIKDFQKYLVPFIMDSINFNAMGFFLVTNALTGLVNVLTDTMSTEYWPSLVTLVAYLFVSCTILCILRVYEIKIRFL